MVEDPVFSLFLASLLLSRLLIDELREMDKGEFSSPSVVLVTVFTFSYSLKHDTVKLTQNYGQKEFLKYPVVYNFHSDSLFILFFHFLKKKKKTKLPQTVILLLTSSTQILTALCWYSQRCWRLSMALEVTGNLLTKITTFTIYKHWRLTKYMNQPKNVINNFTRFVERIK